MRIQSINSNYNIKNYNRMSFKNGSKQVLNVTTDAIKHNNALKELKIGEVVYKGESTLEIVKKYLTYMLQFDMVRFVAGDGGSFDMLHEGEDYYQFEPDDDLADYMNIFEYMNLIGDLHNLKGATLDLDENDKLETVQDLVDFIDKTTKVQSSVA